MDLTRSQRRKLTSTAQRVVLERQKETEKRASAPAQGLPVTPPTPAAPVAHVRRVLDENNHDPQKQLNVRQIATRIIALAQTLSEKEFYPYQIEVAYRIVESLLLHEGDVITALISRQSGKTEVLGSIVAALAVILPKLAKEFPDDWKLNITDNKGVYRGYRDGIKIGIYAPRLDQAEIMFKRVKHALETDTAEQVLKELNLSFDESNGNTVRLSSGSRILCESASEQSKIEGETHHLLVVEEAQDISDQKVRKSLHPMVSSLLGSIVKIGTATTKKCDFYTAIKTNERLEAINGKRNHFNYPYQIAQQYNSLYARYVEKEKDRLGEDSDEFRMAYGCEWIFERGMFVTQEQLFNVKVANTNGLFSLRHPMGLPRAMAQYSVVAGIDWGASSDSTVVTLLAVDWSNPVMSGEYADVTGAKEYICYRKYLLDWLEFIGDDYETQFWRILEYFNTVNKLKKITTDSNTAGRPIFDRLTATMRGTDIEVEDFNFNRKIKSDGYKSLYSDICGQRISFPAGEHTRKTTQYKKFVNQMLDLRKDWNNGLMQVAHPNEKEAHDDYPDSFMLASWGANKPTNRSDIEVLDSNPFFR